MGRISQKVQIGEFPNRNGLDYLENSSIELIPTSFLVYTTTLVFIV